MIRAPERKHSLTPSSSTIAEAGSGGSTSAVTPRMRGRRSSRSTIDVKEIEFISSYSHPQKPTPSSDSKQGVTQDSQKAGNIPYQKMWGSTKTQLTIPLSSTTTKNSIISEDISFDIADDDIQSNDDIHAGTNEHSSCPYTSKFSSNASNLRLLTEDRVHAFLVDYYEDFNSIAPQQVRECWKAFYSRHYAPYYRKIRSSGNSIDSKGLIDMYMSGDLQVKEMTMISIDSIQIVAGGLVAIGVYTADQFFDYKGTHNHDRTVYSVVIEAINGEPKIVQEHRTIGVPVPKESRWDSTTDHDTPTTKSTANTDSYGDSYSVPLQGKNGSGGCFVTSGSGDTLSSSMRSHGSFASTTCSSAAEPPRPPTHIVDEEEDLESPTSEEEKKFDDDRCVKDQIQRSAFDESSRRRGSTFSAASAPSRTRRSSFNQSPIQPRRIDYELEEPSSSFLPYLIPPRPSPFPNDVVESKNRLSTNNINLPDDGGQHGQQRPRQQQRPAFEDSCRCPVGTVKENSKQKSSFSPPSRWKSSSTHSHQTTTI